MSYVSSYGRTTWASFDDASFGDRAPAMDDDVIFADYRRFNDTDVRTGWETVDDRRSFAQETETDTRLERIETLVREFGWQSKGLFLRSLLSKPGYPEFLEFLYNSRLLFEIRGYESSAPRGSEIGNGIRMINDEPHILQEGQWVHWKKIADTFRHDRTTGITTAHSTAPWNYLAPSGLVQQDCYNWISPVHQLSASEVDALYKSSQKYAAAIPEKDQCAYVQVVTDEDDIGDKIAGHVFVRLIDNQGKVYSFGYQRPRSEAQSDKIPSMLATFNAVVAGRDYKELGLFQCRRVTTVPVTVQGFDRVLKLVKWYAASSLRFNFINQNCVTFSTEVLQAAGASIDSRTYSLSKILFFTVAPEWMKKAVRGRQNALSLSAEILSSPLELVKNSLYKALGAGKEGVTLHAVEKESASSTLTVSNPWFKDWNSFFKFHPISARYKLTEWQMEQGSTETHRYKGPRFYIAPDAS